MKDAPPPLPPDIDYQPTSRPEGMSSGAKWGIGCSVGCLFTLLIAGLVGYFIWVKAREIGVGILNQYTSETPVAFVAPAADPGEVDALKTRFDAFSDAMKTGGEIGSLELTGEDINLLIHHHPDWNDLAGTVEAAIEGNQFSGQISIPLDEMGALLKGRYLNGKATFRLALINGSLEGYIDDVEVANQKLPPEVMKQLTAENIFKDSRHDAEFSAFIRTLHELRIENGRLIIVPKPAADRQPAPSGSAEATPAKAE